MEDKRWVLLENGEPHTLLLTQSQVCIAYDLAKEKGLFPKIYTIFYDEYYEFIDYYSDEEKEQINRLIP